MTTEPLTPKSKHTALEGRVTTLEGRAAAPGGLSAQRTTGRTSTTGTVLTARSVRVGAGQSPVTFSAVSLALAPGETLTAADISAVQIITATEDTSDFMDSADVVVRQAGARTELVITAFEYLWTVRPGGRVEVQFNRDVQLLAANGGPTLDNNFSNPQALDVGGSVLDLVSFSLVTLPRSVWGALDPGGMNVVRNPSQAFRFRVGDVELVDPEDPGSLPYLRFKRWNGDVVTIPTTPQ